MTEPMRRQFDLNATLDATSLPVKQLSFVTAGIGNRFVSLINFIFTFLNSTSVCDGLVDRRLLIMSRWMLTLAVMLNYKQVMVNNLKKTKKKEKIIIIM